MLPTKQCCIAAFLVVTLPIFTQNLLSSNSWIPGTGSDSEYEKYGHTSENSREYGSGPDGSPVVLWTAKPDSQLNSDGGFFSNRISINHKQSYRLAVWIKKTNSNGGLIQFKAQSHHGGTHHTLFLDGGSPSWHPFWYGKLPKLNHWYLLVGYIHASDYKSMVSYGKIYDSATGDFVIAMKDHKFKTSAKYLQNKSILWATSNTNDRVYFYAPRIDVINGEEPSVEALLGITSDVSLKFNYDEAGNQIKYCFGGNCSSGSNRPLNAFMSRGLDERQAESEVFSSNEPSEIETIENRKTFKIYPNPTSGLLNLHLHNLEFTSVEIYDLNAKRILQINTRNQAFIHIDLSTYPTGTYQLIAHKIDGQRITRKIIKN